MANLITKHGGYRNLKSFQMSEIVYDLTFEFVKRFVDRTGMSNTTYNYNRQADQMLQAARSGKQNIGEGSQTSGTSKQSEIRLVDVARASMEELLVDYKDFLRANNFSAWEKNDHRVAAIRQLAYESDRTYRTYLSYLDQPESAANCLLTLINQTNFLLDQQLRSLEKDLIAKGDYKDRFKQVRKNQLFNSGPSDEEFLKQFNLKRLENGQVVNWTNRTYRTNSTYTSYKTYLTYFFAFFAFLLLPSAAKAAFANSPLASLQNGLVGYWTLDGQHTNWTRGLTFDQSGKGNNGTLINMSTSTTPAFGKFGQALSFDSNNDYIEVDNESNFDFGSSSPFTISAWVKYTAENNTRYFVAKQQNSATFPGYYFGVDKVNNRLTATIEGNVASCATDCISVRSPANSVKHSTWHHAVWTYNGNGLASGVRLYINGADQALTVAVDGLTTSPLNNTKLRIGGNTAAAGAFLGTIDEVRVYNRALSPSEIKLLYQLGQAKLANSPLASVQSGLTGYWTFDGQHTNWSRGLTYDQSGRGNNGTLTSMSTSTTPVAGKFGQALNFDGNDDRVALPTSAPNLSPGSGNFTISMWVKWNGLPSTNDGLIADANTGNTDSYNIGVSTLNRLRITFDDGPTVLSALTATNYLNNVINTWRHYVGIRDGINIYLYDNTSLITSNFDASLGDIDTDGGFNPVIGSSVSGGTDGVNAVIDDVRVYNRALSVNEIKQLYSLGQAKFGNSPLTQIQNGLIGYWTFDGQHINWTRGLTFDQSGKGNNGTLTSMSTSTTPTAGKHGQALNFDGSNDYVTMGDVNAVDTATTLSACAWVYSKTLASDGTILAKNNATDDGVLFFRDDIGSVSGRANIYTILIADSGDTDTAKIEGAANSAKLNVWTHVCFTYKGGAEAGLRLYIDGTEDPNGPVGTLDISTINVDAQPLVMGIRSGLSFPFNGLIDDVRLYNRVLSAAEVKKLYLLGK